MISQASNFFGSLVQEEVYDEIDILPFAIRNNKIGAFTLPKGIESWEEFDHIEIHMGINQNDFSYGKTEVEHDTFKRFKGKWRTSISFVAASKDAYRLDTIAVDNRTAEWIGSSSIPEATIWPLKIIGFKRRITPATLEEKMAAMSMPNLCFNCDLSNPINFRNFKGDWSKVAVGQYGYDMWMKLSDTHMGHVIDSGMYVPEAEYIVTRDNIYLGKAKAPKTGPFVIPVPLDNSGRYDIYLGQYKRPYHPVVDREARCVTHYNIMHFNAVSYDDSRRSLQRCSVPFPKMRRIPDITTHKLSGDMSASVGNRQRDHVAISLGSTTSSQEFYGYVVLDASISYNDVKNQIVTLQ